MKPIRFSQHALEQMRLRGATQQQVEEIIQTSDWSPAKGNRLQARKVFTFGLPSPINKQIYAFKRIQAIFVDNDDQIVIITALVYYLDEEDSL